MNYFRDLDHFLGVKDPASGEWSVPQQEIAHLHAFRKKNGDHLCLTDGKGYKAEVELELINRKEVKMRLVKEVLSLAPVGLPILAVAMPKNINRLEWMTEKLVEIGIESLIVFTSQHSERQHVRLERLHKKMVAAMKQSSKAFLPPVTFEKSFSDLLELDFSSRDRIIATLLGESLHINRVPRHTSQVIAIGPEGGFTSDEVNMANKAGWNSVSLGSSKLRTETAAIVAATWNNLNRPTDVTAT